MITEGSSALKLPLKSKQTEMEAYLSAEEGYWLQNDIWRTDSAAYRLSGLNATKTRGKLADFSCFTNETLKLEMKYYLLFAIKNGWIKPTYVQGHMLTPLRMAGENLPQACQSFESLDESASETVTGVTSPEVRRFYHALIAGAIKFYADFYDDREETEKDVWHALRIPGVKLSAAMKRQHPSMNFTEIPGAYRPVVKRFMNRLIIRRSWSYCREMLMYIHYFFRMFYKNGYEDGFLEKLSRQDIENYLRWVSEDYEKCNATFRSKAVSFIRSWLDYIQIAEYPQAPKESIERLIFEDDFPRRERAADTIEKVRYIPAPVIQQMDACIEQIEPAEMRPMYVLLRETGWRGTDVLNLRYDNCLQYIWNAKENRSVPYLCGEITKVGIPQLKDPIRDEVAEMVRLVAEEAAAKSTEENNPDRYLFNCYEGRCMGLPFSKPAFSKAVQKMINKNDIRDADGKLFHFKAHSLRHYVECF